MTENGNKRIVDAVFTMGFNQNQKEELSMNDGTGDVTIKVVNGTTQPPNNNLLIVAGVGAAVVATGAILYLTKNKK